MEVHRMASVKLKNQFIMENVSYILAVLKVHSHYMSKKETNHIRNPQETWHICYNKHLKT